MKRIIFEAYEGGNTLHSEDMTIRATVKVPDGASEDYGYLAMKAAILKAYHGNETLSFWYDGQEQHLEADATGGEPEVYIEAEILGTS